MFLLSKRINLKANLANRKYVIAMISILAVLLISLSVIFAIAYMHRHTSSKITFQTYEPTYLPAEETITKKVVEIWRAPAGSSTQDTTMLRLDAGDNIFIYEQNKDSDNTSCAKELDEETCSTERTSSGQVYTLTTLGLPNQPVVQSIRWIKGDTALYMHLSSEDGYDTGTINQAIDSFRPVKYDDLPSVYLDENSF
jgi:hypothetical protein